MRLTKISVKENRGRREGGRGGEDKGVLVFLFYFFNDTWQLVIVHMGAMSSVNGKLNRLTHGCTRLSKN